MRNKSEEYINATAREEPIRYERELEDTREEVDILTKVVGLALGIGIVGLFLGGDCDLDI